jgi:hypothetical protein
MTIPVLGYVSIPDCVFAAYCLFMLIFGLLRGPGKELGSLICACIALGITVALPTHNQAVELLSFLEPTHAQGTAYVAVFCLSLGLLSLLVSQIRILRDLKFPGILGFLFSGISGLLRAVLNISMVLILAVSWKLPWDALFQESQIANFISAAWETVNMFPVLHKAFNFGLDLL